MEPKAFRGISRKMLQSALLMQCPDLDQLEAEAVSAGSFWAQSLSNERQKQEFFHRNEQLMAQLVNHDLPLWLGCPSACDADAFRLRVALDCWDRRGSREDAEGTGLYGAICMELGEPERARSYFEHLEAQGIDLRLAYQPAFLEQLAAVSLWSGSMTPAGSAGDSLDLAGLVQKAAQLACMGVSTGISRRLHGAVLFSACHDGYEVLAEGFNHLAEPLQARRAGSPHKLRAVQRHAEVHCLLQLPRLADAKGKQMLIVEIADVGPCLGSAEPCSRGCVQLLTKYGLSPIFFTDGNGSLVERRLQHDPDLDVPYKTYARRLSDDRISERAWIDVSRKIELEGAERTEVCFMLDSAKCGV
eukprot:s2368_g8.t1